MRKFVAIRRAPLSWKAPKLFSAAVTLLRTKLVSLRRTPDPL